MKTQVPPWHRAIGAQGAPHPPQLSWFVERSVQTPLQAVRPGAQPTAPSSGLPSFGAASRESPPSCFVGGPSSAPPHPASANASAAVAAPQRRAKNPDPDPAARGRLHEVCMMFILFSSKAGKAHPSEQSRSVRARCWRRAMHCWVCIPRAAKRSPQVARQCKEPFAQVGHPTSRRSHARPPGAGERGRHLVSATRERVLSRSDCPPAFPRSARPIPRIGLDAVRVASSERVMNMRLVPPTAQCFREELPKRAHRAGAAAWWRSNGVQEVGRVVIETRASSFTRAPNARDSADRAANQPHMPWTPPPGGVDDEQR